MRRLPILRPVLWDGVVVLAAAILALGTALALLRGGEARAAAVYADGTELDRVALDRLEGPEIRSYVGGGYTVTVEFDPDQGVRVQKADCPTQDCVRTGWIRSGRQAVVCLPARIVVRLEGGETEDGGPDAVIG